MASVTNISCNVQNIQKYTTTRRIPLEIPRSASPATAMGLIKKIRTSEYDGLPLEQGVMRLGGGGYNDVFLISSLPESGTISPFVLRLPKQNSLLPYQVVNEVNCLSIISSHSANIPVPRVRAFASDSPDAFIAQEYVEGVALSSCWNRYTEDEKRQVAYRIAQIIVFMGEIRFDGIGAFTGGEGCLLGPTVEGSKIFKGRSTFHSYDCYNIGPYKTTKEYVLACYDKEIYYYTHAPTLDIDSDLFEGLSMEDFVQQLRDKKRYLEANYEAENEPFVLVHGDFNGRNIMMQGTKIVAVLDWEFSGAYPLSELVGGGVGVDILEVVDDKSEKENSRWSRRILRMAAETATQRSWPKNEVEMLVSDGDPVVGFARMEMCPRV